MSVANMNQYLRSPIARAIHRFALALVSSAALALAAAAPASARSPAPDAGATVALADRVILVDEGQVAADGTHEELLATSARYREVLASSGGPDADGKAVADVG